MSISPTDSTEHAILDRIQQARRYSVGIYPYFVWPYKGIEPVSPHEIRWLIEKLAPLVPKKTDTLLTFMTDGDLLAMPLAQRLDLPLLVCRDFDYKMDHPIRILQKTGYFSRNLYLARPTRKLAICIVDAIIATGATAIAAGLAVRDAGCSLTGVVAAVEKSKHDGCALIQAGLGVTPKVLYRLQLEPHGMAIERGIT